MSTHTINMNNLDSQSEAWERRRSNRTTVSQSPSVLKLRPVGGTHTVEAVVTDVSDNGLGLETREPLSTGSYVTISGVLVNGLSRTILQDRQAKVAHCREIDGGHYLAGLSYLAASPLGVTDTIGPDYYDVLQLSPSAHVETIQRVYRLLAQRYHPDNVETGDQTLFQQLVEAYRVLSDPETRAAYDAKLARTRQLRWRIFDQAAASQGKEGELRKRAGILSLLYVQRLNQPQQPALGIHEMEELLGCPREHLEFPLWYLKESGFVNRGDNGRYSITARGVDESESTEGPMLRNAGLLPEAPRIA